MREVAKVTKCDFGVEDHGIPTMFVMFEFDGSGQGLGCYSVTDTGFIIRFLKAIGVSKMSEAVGKYCWVTHTNSSVESVEPLFKKDGTAFHIKDWQAWKAAHPGFHISASELLSNDR